MSDTVYVRLAGRLTVRIEETEITTPYSSAWVVTNTLSEPKDIKNIEYAITRAAQDAVRAAIKEVKEVKV